jgi:pyridoxine kinase
LFEASQLSGIKEISSLRQMEEAAKIIAEKGAAHVFVKGGSKLPDPAEAVDIFYDGKNCEIITGPLVKTVWTHGAGCTNSAAIAAGLARGLSVRDAVLLAKKFIGQSLGASFALNQWVGPGNPSAWRKNMLF